MKIFLKLTSIKKLQNNWSKTDTAFIHRRKKSTKQNFILEKYGTQNVKMKNWSENYDGGER